MISVPVLGDGLAAGSEDEQDGCAIGADRTAGVRRDDGKS